MYYTSDAILAENQEKLIITVAPYGPQWLPSDFPEDIPVSWDDQVQKAVDCYNAGATVLHIHVRDPETGHMSKNFKHFNYMMERLRKAVPEMVLQLGGSISFAPESEEEQAQWLGYDTRHMLVEVTPKPDQITIVCGSGLMNILDLTTEDDAKGTILENPKVRAAFSGLVADATPEFYIEHLKRLRQHEIQPYFMWGHIHQLEIAEHLIRTGVYMGPLNHNLVAIGGGAAGRVPFDFMEFVRRAPHGSVPSIESWMRTVLQFGAMAIALGIHVRCGIEDNLWRRKGVRMTSVEQIEQMVRIAKELGRKVASGDEAREILKIGTWYNSPDETLANLGLPPNRKEGHLGFMVKETDGKLKPPMVGTTDGLPMAGTHY